MAFSRELTRRLNTSDEPIMKRLKLAENTFTSVDFSITRNEDLVLKWLCRSAEENSGEDADKIWSTLSRCLSFNNNSSNITLKNAFKQTLIETLIKRFNHIEDNCVESVLSCCNTVFMSREMRQYFQFEPASLGELTKALFSFSHRLSGMKNVDKNSWVSSRNCAINAVECIANCGKKTADKDNYLRIFVAEILYSLCVLMGKEESDKLGAETHKCIQQILFCKSKYSQFKDYDGGEENFAGKLFKELRKKTKIVNEDTSLVVFLYVFRAAVGLYKNDSAMIDSIFRCLVESAASLRFKVSACLCRQMTNATLDYQNRIGEKTLFDYLGDIIDEIILRDSLDNFDYEALAAIAALNPLIAEMKIQPLFRKILMTKKETSQDSNSYRDLMIVLTCASVRLRREQKLVSWILTAIEETAKKIDSLELDVDEIFPKDFKTQFGKALGNMTSTQTIGIFRTLIFHLNNCVEMFAKDKNIAIITLLANVDLMSAYFEAVRIFDYSVTMSGQEKFVQALKDLGKVISTLTERALNIKKNRKIIVAILTIAWYWENLYSWMRYYAPEAVVEELEFPLSELHIRKIIEKTDNAACKRVINRILLRQIARSLDNSTTPDFTNLPDDFAKSWSIILDENPRILSSMDNSQIAEFSRYFHEDLETSEPDSLMKRLSKDSVENNERLVTALVCQTLSDIAVNVDDGTMTKIITRHVNVIKILDHGKVSKVLKEIKNEFAKNEWISMSEKSIPSTERNLRILLALPLKHLSLKMRTLIFLVTYSIKKECQDKSEILTLCRDLTLDLSEKFDIDIIDYIEPNSLIRESTNDKSMRRVFESSLRHVTSWERLKIFLNNSQSSGDESSTIFLECLERVRTKLRNDQREIFKKAEQRLSKKLLESANVESTNHGEIKRFTVAIKVSAANGEISEKSIDSVKLILQRIFVSEASKDEILVNEGLQLVVIALKHREKFTIDDEIIANVWPHVLKNSIKDLAQPLVEKIRPKALKKLFALLHVETISGLDESRADSFARASTMWNSILKVRMGDHRQKLRTSALQNLLEYFQISKISTNVWPGVLKLSDSILSQESHVVVRLIDLAMLLAGRALREAEFLACENVLTLCSSLVKFHNGIVTDRLPILLALYRQIVRIIARESRRTSDSSMDRKIRCLALDIEKLTNSLVKLKKDLSRISPYVIADLVDIFSQGVIPSHVKGPLEDSAGHFLSICDQHAISLLSRTLPTSTQGIFKTLYETYNKFYKFTGKI